MALVCPKRIDQLLHPAEESYFHESGYKGEVNGRAVTETPCGGAREMQGERRRTEKDMSISIGQRRFLTLRSTELEGGTGTSAQPRSMGILILAASWPRTGVPILAKMRGI